MKLDRTDNQNGKGKYALVKLRELEGRPQDAEDLAEAILTHPESVDWGLVDSDSEFFVIRLKDVNAYEALMAYAKSVAEYDPEFAEEVFRLAIKSRNHKKPKRPD